MTSSRPPFGQASAATLVTDPRKAIAFIGAVGLPNRYGGFEAFLEHCAPEIARAGFRVIVTCERTRYPDQAPFYEGVERRFIALPANGVWSIVHDLLAFFSVFRDARHVVILGVSGGPWFPLFRVLSSLVGTKLAVNVDGVEWMRGKFGFWRRTMLRVFDSLAQFCAHRVIIDNAALAPFLLKSARAKSSTIAYSGDHVLRVAGVQMQPGRALTICRIEPENNIEMLLEAVASSAAVERYTVIGNWQASQFGQRLRSRYASDPRFQLLDPVYDQTVLAQEREACAIYLHGHSVGGTNPSLVEMIFYDCEILCFDVPFHRFTVGESARFFDSSVSLARMLDDPAPPDLRLRRGIRRHFLKSTIAAQYCEVAGLPNAKSLACTLSG